MEEQLLILLKLIYQRKLDFWESSIMKTMEATLIELEEKHLIAMKRKPGNIPKLSDAVITKQGEEVLRQYGMI